MCIIELMIQILGNKVNLDNFKTDHAVENVLSVLTSSDEIEVKKRILYLLIELMYDEDIIDILKEQHVLGILANQIEQTRLVSIHNEGEEESTDDYHNIKIGFWDCLKVLSTTKHDILVEFRRMHIIGTLLDELELTKNPFHQMSLLEILTNLTMDDQNAVVIRE
jgi:hypothetical protein